MALNPAYLNSGGKVQTGWLPLWGYPVLASAILCILAAATFGLVAPLLGQQVESPEGRRAAGSVPVPAERVVPQKRHEPPVAIEIPRAGVSAPVDPLGLNRDGTMEVPTDYARTGWYTGLESPGMPGTAVIVGHLDSHTGPAVFHRLRELTAGDEVVVKLADGQTAHFQVDRTAKYPKDRFPTIDVYAPSTRPVLRLITCGGTFDRRSRHYRDNVVVYASQKMSA